MGITVEQCRKIALDEAETYQQAMNDLAESGTLDKPQLERLTEARDVAVRIAQTIKILDQGLAPPTTT